MAGWIESHQSLKTHRKTYKLARLLHVGRAEAIGMLHALWWWALDGLPDGVIAIVDDDTLKDVCLCRFSGEKLREALIKSGFVDEETQQIHDWSDYIGRLLERRERDRERKEKWKVSMERTRKERGKNAERTRKERGKNAEVRSTDRTDRTDRPGVDLKEVCNPPPPLTLRGPAHVNDGGEISSPPAVNVNGSEPSDTTETLASDGEKLVAFYRSRMDVHKRKPDTRLGDARRADEHAAAHGLDNCLAAVYVLTDVISESDWEAKQGRPLRFLWLRWEQLGELRARHRASALHFARIEGVMA